MARKEDAVSTMVSKAMISLSFLLQFSFSLCASDTIRETKKGFYVPGMQQSFRFSNLINVGRVSPYDICGLTNHLFGKISVGFAFSKFPEFKSVFVKKDLRYL